MQKNHQDDRAHEYKGADVPKMPAGSSSGQLSAKAAAKDAHLKEAGLGGNRTGQVSATGKIAQAHRDAANDTSTENNEKPKASPKAGHPQDHSIQVQVNTAHNIHGGKKLDLYVHDAVNSSLGRFDKLVTRVEIHLSDEHASKSHGDEKRCLLEARPAGHQPLVVTHIGATINEAVDGAVDMMKKLLDRTFEKLRDTKGRASLGKGLVL
jgi:ribosome-associated translation inhibitor RaiA